MRTAFYLLALFAQSLVIAQVEDLVTGLRYAAGFAIHNNELYFGDGTHFGDDAYIYKLDLDEPNSSPTVVNYGLHAPYDFVLYGDELYVLDVLINILYKFDLTQPNPTPQLVRILNEPRSMALNENMLYISDPDLHQIISLNLNLPNPTPQIFIQTAESPENLYFHENYLYVVFPDSHTIKRIDLSVPNGALEEVLQTTFYIMDVLVKGNELLVSDYFNDRILKYNPDDNPSIPSTLLENLAGPTDMILVGDTLYFVQFDLGVISKFEVTLGYDEVAEDKGIALYPNPTDGLLHIAQNAMPLSIKVNTMNGEQLPANFNNGILDLSGVPSGIYLVEVVEGDGKRTLEKVIKH